MLKWKLLLSAVTLLLYGSALWLILPFWKIYIAILIMMFTYRLEEEMQILIKEAQREDK